MKIVWRIEKINSQNIRFHWSGYLNYLFIYDILGKYFYFNDIDKVSRKMVNILNYRKLIKLCIAHKKILNNFRYNNICKF